MTDIGEYIGRVFPDAHGRTDREDASEWFVIHAELSVDGSTYVVSYRYSEFDRCCGVEAFNRKAAGIVVQRMCDAIMDGGGK